MTTNDANKPKGHRDTPILPETSFHVHDPDRPQPVVVAPDPRPSDAVALFDGRDLSHWESKRDGGDAPWKVENGYMEVVPHSGAIRTREEFGDGQLHVEWAAPTEITGDGQGRGNSGIFLQGLYEIQVLDGYRRIKAV